SLALRAAMGRDLETQTPSSNTNKNPMPTIPAPELESFAAAVLRASGATEAEAQRVAESLLDSNLRGYESHGVMRIPYYVDQIAKGEIKPDVELTILDESPAKVVADGNWGFGQVQAQRLTHK